MPGSRKPDPRFVLHGQQPRADKLSQRQRGIASQDPAFAEALRLRVSDPARYAAFMLGQRGYKGKPCPKCGSTLRRVRDRSCFTCLVATTAPAMQAIRQGHKPPATRSRDSHLDLLARRKTVARTYSRGNWTATVDGLGRTTLHNHAANIACADFLRAVRDNPERWFALAQRDGHLQALLSDDLGW